MKFENNWVYPVVSPYSNVMYDPVLKVRAQINDVREAGPTVMQIDVYYDPEIEADHLTVPVSEETKARWRSSPLRKHKADDDSIRWSFRSEKEIKVTSQVCSWDRVGNTVRLKIHSSEENVKDKKRIITSLNIPIISKDPLSFLDFVYKNCINVCTLENEFYTEKLFPDAKRVEICLSADAFLNAFNLSPDDYTEVEAGWFCLASKEVVR
jgi:hypothetical protein